MIPPRLWRLVNSRPVEISLGEVNREHGLRQIEHTDGLTAPAVAAGKSCRELRRGQKNRSYIYFQIDDSFKWARTMDVMVEVDYYDGNRGSFTVQYDSHDPSATLDGAYKDCAESVAMKAT